MKIDQLRSCDILLYKGKGFRSWLIQWGTKSPYNHVAVMVSPEMNLGVESNTGHQSGVQAFDVKQFKAGEIDVFRVKSRYPFNKSTVISYLVAHLGAKFDWIGVSALGLMKFLSFFTAFKAFTWHNEFQRKKDYFCSELVYEAFKAGNLDIVPEIDEAAVTSPADISKSSVVEKIIC